jgi:hypothetical protein
MRLHFAIDNIVAAAVVVADMAVAEVVEIVVAAAAERALVAGAK